MQQVQWILCPVCGSKTRNKIRPDTTLTNFPLYCPKCKHESLIKAENMHITVISQSDPCIAAADVRHLI